MYFNRSEIAVLQLNTVASTLSLCIKLTVQRTFLGITVDLGNNIYRGDTIDAYTHSLAPNDIFLVIDNTYMEWYKSKFHKKEISRKYALPVNHALQGHSESVKCGCISLIIF